MHKLFTILFIFCFGAGVAFALPETAQNQPQEPQTVQSVEEIAQDETDTAAEVQTREDEIDKLNEEMGLGEQKNIVVDDVEASPNDNVVLTKNVVPDTKSELYKMIKMFLKVMAAVALSSVIILVLLLFVKRFYSPKVTIEDLNKNIDDDNSLLTPQNKSEALKTFLDKTKEV